jgi:hypothetical protein
MDENKKGEEKKLTEGKKNKRVLFQFLQMYSVEERQSGEGAWSIAVATVKEDSIR